MIGTLAALAIATTLGTAPAPVVSFVEAPGPAGALKGTMLTPPAAKGPPVVLIIPGSGPTDRDGDSPLGVKAAPYRLLAQELASRGVASVRVDKRGMFASAAAVPDANAVTLDDYVKDVGSWVTSIRHRTGAACIWLLGHSEGGLVALASADKIAGLCGVIAVAAPGRPLGEVLRRQLEANPANAPILSQAESAIDALEAGRRVDVAALHPALQALFSPAVQGFEISVFKPDPAAIAHALRLPLLIVQGAADLQVSADDAERLKAANPAAQLALLPDANHVLKTASAADRAGNLATYADPGLPLAAAVTPVIASFIDKHATGGR